MAEIMCADCGVHLTSQEVESPCPVCESTDRDIRSEDRGTVTELVAVIRASSEVTAETQVIGPALAQQLATAYAPEVARKLREWQVHVLELGDGNVSLAVYIDGELRTMGTGNIWSGFMEVAGDIDPHLSDD